MNQVQKPQTVPQLLRHIVEHIHPDTHPFLTDKVNKQWVNISYREAIEKIDAITAWLLHVGVCKGDRIGLVIENGPDYIYYDQALQQLGAINTSIYPTLTEAETEYIINDSGLKTLLVGNPFLLRKVLKVANNCASLERIIPAFEDYEKHTGNIVLNAGVISLQDVVNEGLTLVEQYRGTINSCREAILPSDLSCLIYTSGTTGTPKGVMLMHSNFVQTVWAGLEQISNVNKDDCFLSFLPLSHVFERAATYYICMGAGARIAFAESLDLLARNMAEVKPTIMNCVPRLLERIHDKAMKNGADAGGMKTKIFNWAFAIGQKHREVRESGKKPGIILRNQHKLAEKLVFRKIKEKTGGRLKFLISGGGALPKNVGEFFGNIGLPVLEGYGLTETTGPVCVTEFQRQVYGTAGRILPGSEVGIQDIETKKIHTVQTHNSCDANFTSPEGEIIIRGVAVMKGYWNKAEETSLAIDKDGWFHSGDIGRFYKGYLQITDRLKNMLVNAYGKNIYPTPVENAYLKSLKIEQIFLVGDRREYVTAIIIPPKELLQETFNLSEDWFKNPEIFVDNKEIIDWLKQDIRKLSNGLAKFERIKNFKVKRNPFSMEDGEITVTMKAKRKVIEKKYAEAIEEMYAQEIDAD
ncbi:AMP-dependent synthetase/ligase [Mucilaginibacter aquatilis]|uniref:AMP-binding protein n=1 Tax=Mucilaginibacter aquatilis TaxID=1517760 RepID=A0A6I4I324_9SPHI|nr:long-chain fatty acid--CoA ligase [Mucilaginibacter aquatilis]MVN89532.1 AMP-binding protein [Mucilaginibacter aquatilis]